MTQVNHSVVVIGTSAGGVTALQELVAALPADFPVAVCVVLHIPSYTNSYLPQLLSGAGALPARHPQDGEVLLPGTIYVAPPDHHLLLEAGRVLIKHGPKENRFRPSVDALFRSAAYAYGPRVIGVVLTGYLDDGTSGLWTIQRLGGLTVVQDPAEAYVPDMPTNALAYVTPDYVAPLADIGPLLVRLAALAPTKLVQASSTELEQIRFEVGAAKGPQAYSLGLGTPGKPSGLVCPECQGPLMQLVEGPLRRYRCLTGHSFTLSALLAGVRESVEGHLYGALQNVEQAQLLLQHLSEQTAQDGPLVVAAALHEQALQAEQQSRVLQQAIATYLALSSPSGSGASS